MRCDHKKFFGQVRLAAVLFGTVAGAGFVSGAELVRFFPLRAVLPYSVLAGLLLFFGFFLLFACGRRFGGYEGMLRAAFGKGAPAVRAAVFCVSMIVCAGMLAGLDAVMSEGFGVPESLPVFSAAALIAAALSAGKGTSALAKVNLCLVPAILLFAFSLACGVRGADNTFPPEEAFPAIVRVIAYAAMNVFLAAPVVAELGAETEGGAGGSLLAAALIGGCIAAILLRIASVCGAADALIPVLFVMGRGGAGKIFALVSAAGILTTLFSSYYPLHLRTGACRRPRLARASVCAAVFALSRFGLKTIVGKIYPVFGAAGILFLFACAAAFQRGCRITVFSASTTRKYIPAASRQRMKVDAMTRSRRNT